MRISWSGLEEAFEFASFGRPGEAAAFLCKETGKIYLRSYLTEDVEELPDDLDDSDKYIEIPHKNELGLGKRLVLEFARESLPDAVDEVRAIFGRRGAYAQFKTLLMRRGALQQWYDYQASAQKRASREWCEENSLEIGD